MAWAARRSPRLSSYTSQAGRTGRRWNWFSRCPIPASPSVPKNAVDGFADIHVIRLGSTSGSCTVNFATGTNGTAVIGTDYYPTNALITFNPGQTNVIIQIAI